MVWTGLIVLAVGPVLLIAASPWLAGRGVVYVSAGIAGAAALSVLLIQPLLASGWLPGLSPGRARRLHRALGSLLVGAVVLHVGGLYLTSPPDALDALLLLSPTPFSVWGVLAMWATILTALLVAARRRLRLSPQVWATLHNALALIVVAGSVIHALLIRGLMEPVSKTILCIAVLAATGAVVLHLRVVRPLRRRTG